MKTLAICGDSFAVADPDYGPMWAELLADMLGSEWTVHNTSSVAASNLLINIQTQQAIQRKADWVIVLATAVTRDHVSVLPATHKDLLTRFDRGELVSYSIYRPYRSALTPAQQQAVQQYQLEYFDLDLAIHRDQCIIENTLQRLTDAGCRYMWDQGGFEHPSHGARHANYFGQYNDHRSAINLWDLATTVAERPRYHIDSAKQHERIAEYYYENITR